MIIEDIIIVVVLVAIALGVLIYVGKKKKSGAKCIGCAHSDKCSGNCQSGQSK